MRYQLTTVLLIVFLTNYVKSGSNFIKELLSQMSVEDKCGQMTQITLDALVNLPESNSQNNPLNMTKLDQAIKKYKIGSILNTAYDKAHSAQIWQQIIELIQTKALSTQLKIPILYGLDSIHGANYIQEATLFPQPLAMASSFNIDISNKIGQISAMETRAIGVPWNFNPVLDIGRQNLWPRLYETYGEDVYLAVEMGKAYITGSQENSLKNRTKVATCLKHYIGYSYPLNGRDRSDAWIPDNILREYFLPTFAAGIRAGAQTVMINSATVNGIPTHSNSYYINDILKGELKFKGFTVSDWEDIIRLYTRDKVVASPEEAVKLAVMSGVDMSMVPYDYSFFNYCVNLAQKDKAFLKRVNDATKRILRVKYKIGLFDQNGNASLPIIDDLNIINRNDSYEFNLEAARETIVLAKNEESFLPLNKNDKILVVGTSGNSLRVLNGGWSYKWQGNNESYFKQFAKQSLTIFEAIKKKTNQNEPKYVEGANFTHEINLDIAIKEATNAQVIILCIGEESYAETFGNIDNLFLNEAQLKLANTLVNLNKSIVLIYLGGRPRIITNLVESLNVKGVLISFLPGNRGAEAIVDILFGDYNPNARLPLTYPRNPNGHTTYDLRPIETYSPNKYEYLFPFGYGLSYTNFEFSDLKVNQTLVDCNKGVKVSVKVKNTGQRDGKEIVILYLNDQIASISRPIKQLKGFKKIFLSKNEEMLVDFDLTSYDFTFINKNGKRIAENGVFNVYVSNLKVSFELENCKKSSPKKSVSKKKKNFKKIVV